MQILLRTFPGCREDPVEQQQQQHIGQLERQQQADRSNCYVDLSIKKHRFPKVERCQTMVELTIVVSMLYQVLVFVTPIY